MEKMSKSLHVLDKKGGGREIAGLPPRNESFSKLAIERDIVDLKRNKKINTEINLDDLYVFLNPTKGTEVLQVEAPHWRTISQENIHTSFESEQGREYYYTANIKGVGYLKPTLRGQSIDEWEDWNRIDEYNYEGAFGMGGKDDFYSEEGDLVMKSKWLTNKGLRTELYASYGRLKNVYYQGVLTPIRELRDKRIIPSQKLFIPHIGIRLLKTNTRIAEIKESEPERARELFIKAFEIFNKETQEKGLPYPQLEIGNRESEKIFFQVFFERMGSNVAVFQNLGLIGWHLHSANTTLAAEIVDIGPYQSWESATSDEFLKLYHGVRRGVWKDLRDIAYTLKFLLKGGAHAGLLIPDENQLMQGFMDHFSAQLIDESLEGEQMKRADVEFVAHAILNAVIVQHRSLPALKHGANVTDWGII